MVSIEKKTKNYQLLELGCLFCQLYYDINFLGKFRNDIPDAKYYFGVYIIEKLFWNYIYTKIKKSCDKRIQSPMFIVPQNFHYAWK